MRKDGISFPENMILLFRWKIKDDLSQKKKKKKKKKVFSQKNTLKDFFHKKILMILCTFMENFIGVFIHRFPNRKQEA